MASTEGRFAKAGFIGGVIDAANEPGTLAAVGAGNSGGRLHICSAGRLASVVRQSWVLRPVVIPTYDEVPVFIIRNNLKTAGISRDEYFRLLEAM